MKNLVLFLTTSLGVSCFGVEMSFSNYDGIYEVISRVCISKPFRCAARVHAGDLPENVWQIGFSSMCAESLPVNDAFVLSQHVERLTLSKNGTSFSVHLSQDHGDYDYDGTVEVEGTKAGLRSVRVVFKDHDGETTGRSDFLADTPNGSSSVSELSIVSENFGQHGSCAEGSRLVSTFRKKSRN